MAKLTCFLLVLVSVVLCAEAVRIDPPRPTFPPGKYFPTTTITKKNDPRCKKNGIIANPDDCTRYIKCKNGNSQDRKCPDSFKFDSVKRCTPDKDADCGKTVLRGVDPKIKCPKDFGMFEFEGDCHKFIICKEGKATVHECPKHHVYNDINGGCVQGDVCPHHSSEPKCSKETDRLPVPMDCRSYLHCVNWKGTVKKCPVGTAFDPRKKQCTAEWLKKCRNNDVRNIVRDDE
ncbi:uncharacterized protein TNIN_328891 [Trichonephila inaurata madagascariensis]|uniref:Chitin-binding type-2 domain-containing protein n=1 Tax=Trichonephila inaurata madagascariensis TaxID=2747483 RepID=A0A8X6WWP7_9ARAC|nr:uncharacterized protein TNIN_328891 [Trichonephila inaurata madagascariensis]